jgi:hypothetical protein
MAKPRFSLVSGWLAKLHAANEMTSCFDLSAYLSVLPVSGKPSSTLPSRPRYHNACLHKLPYMHIDKDEMIAEAAAEAARYK